MDIAAREADGAGRAGRTPGGRLCHPLARFAALRAAGGTRGSHFAARGDAAPAATRPVTLAWIHKHSRLPAVQARASLARLTWAASERPCGVRPRSSSVGDRRLILKLRLAMRTIGRPCR